MSYLVERAAELAQFSWQKIKGNKDRIILSLGSAAASGIPLVRNPNIPNQEWGLDDPRALLICVGSSLLFAALVVAFHKDHEFRYRGEESEDKPRRQLSQIQAMKKFVDTGDSSGFLNCQAWNYKEWNYMSAAGKQEASAQILLETAGWIRDTHTNQKIKELFNEFATKNPKSDLASWSAYLRSKTGYVTQAQHERLVARVAADENVLAQTHNLTQDAHQRLDGHDSLIASQQARSARQQGQIDALADSSNRVVSFLDYMSRGRHQQSKQSGKLLPPPRK